MVARYTGNGETTEGEQERKNRGTSWWVWVIVIIVAFVVGVGVGRAGPSDEETTMISDAADIVDGLAASMEVAAESQEAELEMWSSWIDTIMSEIDALRELKAEYPDVTTTDEAIDSALDAHRQALLAAELVEKYWDASKVEADRLRRLAATIRR